MIATRPSAPPGRVIPAASDLPVCPVLSSVPWHLTRLCVIYLFTFVYLSLPLGSMLL